MQLEIYNQVKGFNMLLYTATKRMMDISARAHERLIQEQFAMAGRCLEDSVEQFELVRDAEDILGYFTAQTEQLQKCSDRITRFAQRNTNILAETRDEFDSWSKESLSDITSLISLLKSDST